MRGWITLGVVFAIGVLTGPWVMGLFGKSAA